MTFLKSYLLFIIFILPHSGRVGSNIYWFLHHIIPVQIYILILQYNFHDKNQ